MNKNPTLIALTFILFITVSCTKKEENKETLFELLKESETGISFSNDLEYTDDFNVYKYRNFYNGGGVALGDINNDGLLDIYFTANQEKNRLYLNKGNFKFEDITDKAGVAGNKPWSTGVNMVDINADGYLDIYVCNSGDLKGHNKQNELFINQQNGTFKEQAEHYGLADQGFSTHASFFDYDKDGDLDVYLLNNSYQAIGSFDLRRAERPKRDKLGGDKLLKNVDGKFIDVSEEAGIYGSVIGFGLGVTIGDVNNDGWEDIYISNDFFERDYLYINQHNGTFKEDLENQISSTSAASMGADMADINNDGYNDIFVTDMLPSDYKRLKTVTTFEDWNRYRLKVDNDYHHQFTRNTFQLNNSNNSFSEISRLSGVDASDWSWGALLFDMDNDGFKDLFIANGIYRDITNQDYLQYISNEEILKSIVTKNQVDYKKLIDIIPSNKVPNHAYKNNGELFFNKFEDSGLWTESFSNGSAYGDLDNDGDLDLVVNNVNMPCFIYKNNSREKFKTNYIKFQLKGSTKNLNAIGSKIILDNGQSIENQPARGFQSSMDTRPNFGLPNNEVISGQIIWPSSKVSTFENLETNKTYTFHEKEAKDYVSLKPDNQILLSQSTTSIPYLHKENRFVDFHKDRLLYHMYSTQGPKMVVEDLNGDGTNDLVIGGSKGTKTQLFLGKNSYYTLSSTKAFDDTSNFEDTNIIAFDADNDGDKDLLVSSGGIEYAKNSPYFRDRLYINDGSGNFNKTKQPFPSISSSAIAVTDYNNDGFKDIFLGERLIPLNYGKSGSGYLFENDGQGNYKDVTAIIAPGLRDLGMITAAEFVDVNNDQQMDLVVVGEFMGIEIFINNQNRLEKWKDNPLSKLKGWWNTIKIADLNNDNLPDLIIGNHGLNTRFKASEKRPISLYINDYDGNGFLDPILAFKADNNKDYPFALRHNLIDQIKPLKKVFPDYNSFKDLSMDKIFSETILADTEVKSINTLKSIIVFNKGKMNFEVKDLPIQAQFTTLLAIETLDIDSDGDLDVFVGGNLYGVKPEIGRYDALNGLLIENKGNGIFKGANHLVEGSIKGEIRDIKYIDNQIFVSRNKDSILTLEIQK